MLRVIIIANPVAGRHAGSSIAAFEQALIARGCTVEIRYTAQRGDGRALARAVAQSAPDAVAAAGGDGTINEVASGLAHSGVAMGVLPLGTANVLAHELGLPGDAEGLAAVITAGKREVIHLGRCGDQTFLLMAGIGFDAQAVAATSLRIKRWAGRLAYGLGGLQTLASLSLPRLALEVDGEDLEGYSAVVSNARHYGGRFVVSPEAGLGRPYLDLCLFTRPGRLRMLSYLWSILNGKHTQRPDVVTRAAHHISVRAAGAAVLQLDGDVAGRLPVTLTLEEDALVILRPQ